MLLRSLVFAVLLAAGCKPEIGDSCSLSTDCSAQGDRLCDITMPGGYCTTFNCEPGRCPEESTCVAFTQQPDSVCTDPSANTDPQDPQRWRRFQRTFCVRTCGSNDDCRGGYLCIGGNDLHRGWNAEVVDDNTNAVCLPAFTPAPQASSAPAICQQNDLPKLTDIPVYSGSAAGSGGAAGASGAGGASGEAGAAGDAGQAGDGGAAGDAGAAGDSGG